MAASYNAKKIILKNFNFETLDVNLKMSRPKRFGRDSNLVSDGTINDVYIYQYFMH